MPKSQQFINDLAHALDPDCTYRFTPAECAEIREALYQIEKDIVLAILDEVVRGIADHGIYPI